MQLSILPVGEVEEDVLRDLSHKLEGGGFQVMFLPRLEVPVTAYNKRRRQYRAPGFLELARGQKGDSVLAITGVDLYDKPLNFVFGQAEMGGKAAVVSLHRLRSPDRDLFLQRALKEVVHELGHTNGLEHCPDKGCVMHFSNTLEDTDLKGPGFCSNCGSRLPDAPHWQTF